MSERLAAGRSGGRLREASYLTVSGADQTGPQYRAIVDVLLAQQQESLTGVGLDELSDLLAAHVEAVAGHEAAAALLADVDLEPRMAQLTRWGVVKAWDDRSLRPENFLRNATRYQLTATAAQLHRAVVSLGVDDESSLAATFAPGVLVAQLEALAEALGTEPTRAAESWAVIRSTLDGMSRAAQGWQATLADALSGAPDTAKVGSLQETLQRYLTIWAPASTPTPTPSPRPRPGCSTGRRSSGGRSPWSAWAWTPRRPGSRRCSRATARP